MSKDAWLVTGGDETTQALNAGNVNFNAVGQSGRFIGTSTEAQTQLKVKAGVIDKLRWFVSACTATNFYTVRSRVNTANGNLSSLQTTGTTGEYEDLTHSDTLVDGDLVDISITGGVTAASSTVSGTMGVHYLATASITTAGALTGNSVFQAGFLAASYFGLLLGGYHAGIMETTEAKMQHRVRAPAALSGFRTDVTANTNTITCTYSVRVGGATVNGTTSYASTTTGIVEDLTHTDTVATADLVGFKVAASSANNIQASIAAIVVVGSNQQWDATGEGPSAQGSTTVVHFCQLTAAQITGATEANRQQRVRWASSANNIRASTLNNASTGFTWTFRLNGGDGTQSITVGSGATGFTEDLTHKDAIASGDLINYKLGVTSNTSIQSHLMITMGLSSNNAAIGTVFGGITLAIAATNIDAAGIAMTFGRFSQAAAVTVDATFRGPIAMTFGQFSQVVVANDIGVRGTGIRRFWTF
jgi:hypothetical protein